jgi:ketosteroid isomerase-like protein
MSDSLQVAERLFAAIMSGDIDGVRDVYHPDVVVWHNNDQQEQGRDANLAVLSWCVHNIDGMRYENVRRHATEAGFVQQHVLRGRFTKTGAELEVPACIVCEVKDGQITRLDEYLDSAQVASLRG